MNVVYLSVRPETAMREAVESYRYYNLPEWKHMPKVTVAIDVAINFVIDLTDKALAAALPQQMTDLLAEDWRKVMDRSEEASTQALGRAAYNAGFQGILVPSKPDATGVNLIIFPDRLGAGCRLAVLDQDALEKLGKPP